MLKIHLQVSVDPLQWNLLSDYTGSIAYTYN